jgi:cytochrome c55X
MDCARCHGRDYGGWSAPSLIAAVRDGTRERFDRYVLEGDAMRGMPGYRSQPLVVAELDAIYAHLLSCAARGDRRCGSGRPE